MKYQVCIPSYHGEGGFRESDAYSEEEAAADALKEMFENDAAVAFDQSVFVLVRKGDDGEPKLHWAHAEQSIDYWASEAELPILCKDCRLDVTKKLLSGGDLYEDSFCSKKCHDNYYIKLHNRLGI